MSSKPKICSVVGARPQFVKAAVVSRKLRESFDEVSIHTGQHYDDNLSRVFFDELSIPAPSYNLGIGSGSHGKQTGKMLVEIERVLVEEAPCLVIIYGDTNSTLAGALAAAKLHIPLAHVEAGLRSYRPEMPEEINRVLSDHVSAYLFCPTATAVDNLKNEGISEGIFLMGDVMKDALQEYLPVALKRKSLLGKNQSTPKNYFLLTMHRAENTGDPLILETVFGVLSSFPQRIVFPLHPRTRTIIDKYDIGLPSNVITINPVGYLDMLHLEAKADLILTDSGGVQK